MKLLLVQLSDIHIRSHSDPILTRSRQIAEAIQALQHYQIDICIFVLSGDVAFSGTESEYGIAYDFLQNIIKHLNKLWGGVIAIHWVSIPGNHDCDFSTPQVARQVLINGLDKKQQAVDDSIIKICMEVQKTFFDFRDSIEGVENQRTFFWERTITTKEGSILFRCYNTSWVSQLHEAPGTLFFPIGMSNLEPSDADVTISLLHHPYNWFDPDNARIVRTHLEKTSDIILTGHEHVPVRRIQRVDTGEVNEYIEGGVLQESGEPSISSFNVLLIDTSIKQQKFVYYKWNGDIYKPHGPEPTWEIYQVNRLREENRFAINDSFLKYLQDPGVRLEHPAKGVLSLTDIFVYPDLREINDKPGEISQTVIHGDGLFSECGKDNLLLLGAEQSGKTSLAKTLFCEYHKRGYIPLLVDGTKFRTRRLDGLADQFAFDLFREQYDADNIEYYRQLDRQKRIIIIDNFHALRFRRKEEENFLNIMEKFAGKLVFLANDLAQQVNKIVEGGLILEHRLGYRQFRILPFGHVLRNTIVEQWCLLDHNLSHDEEALAKKVITIERVIDTVIGKNFVPAYPVFLLAMLQGQEGTTSFNTNAGTYGYFYELLIRHSLAHGTDKVQFNIKLGYLAYLAFEIYQSGNHTFTSSDLQSIHERYQKRYSFKLNYQASRQELVKHGILNYIEGSFNFKYKYIYYYFVASYLSDHITEQAIRDEIIKLSSQLDDEDSANILLFLAHLSKDPFIINQMLDKAAQQYEEFESATLRDDTSFLRADGQSLNLKYVEKDINTARRERLENLDRAIYEEKSEPVAPDTNEVSKEFRKFVQIMTRLTAAFRTMQILGQLLKNFVGTMEGSQKKQIAKECYSLGLRILSSILNLLKTNQTELIQYLINVLRGEHSALSERELEQMARANIFDMAHMVSFNAVKRISSIAIHKKIYN